MKTLVDCDCRGHAYDDGSGLEIDYCSTHQAASELLAACKSVLVMLRLLRILSEKGFDLSEEGFDKEIANLEAVIARAEGK